MRWRSLPSLAGQIFDKLEPDVRPVIHGNSRPQTESDPLFMEIHGLRPVTIVFTEIQASGPLFMEIHGLRPVTRYSRKFPWYSRKFKAPGPLFKECTGSLLLEPATDMDPCVPVGRFVRPR